MTSVGSHLGHFLLPLNMTFDELCSQIHETEGDGTAVPNLRAYLRAGGDINALDAGGASGILHVAAEHCDCLLVDEMARLGADMDMHHALEGPPIFRALDIDIDGAIQTGSPINFEVTKCFVRNGSRTDLKNRDGRTIHEFAAAYGDDVAQLLLKSIGEA